MPLREGNYNVLPIKFPLAGMNTTVTPQALPFTFARYLENLIPSKAGTGVVRFGTVLLTGATAQNMAADSKILEVIPYINNNGVTDTLVYAYDFLRDTTVSEIFWHTPSKITFTCENPSPGSAFNPLKNFQNDQPLKITYQIGGLDFTIYPLIQSASFTGSDPNYIVEITLDSPLLPNNQEQGTVTQYNSDVSFDVGPLDEVGWYPTGLNVQVAFTIPTRPVVSITHSGAVATVTATGSNLPTASNIFGSSPYVTISGVTGADAALYNGYFPVTVVDADTFTYTMTGTPANDAPNGNYGLEPFVRWPTGTPNEGQIVYLLGSPIWQLSANGIIDSTAPVVNNFAIASMVGAQGANPLLITQVTAFLSAPIGLKNGDEVVISGCTPSEYNGTFTVYNISSAGTSFSYDIPGQFLGDASVPGTFTLSMYTINATNPILPSFPVAINAVFNSGPPITVFQPSFGAIKTFNEGTGHYTDIANNLNAVCIPRYHAFSDVSGDVVFIYNGVDDVVYWDGTTLTTVYDFVPYSILNALATPPTTNGDPTYIGQNSFSVVSNPAYEDLFVAGSPIQLNIGASSDSLTITSISNTDGVATAILPGPSNLKIGDVVVVSGASPADYNGSYEITDVSNVSIYSFSYNLTTAAASGSSTATYYIPELNVQGTISGIVPPSLGADGTLTITTVENILPFLASGDTFTINSVFYSEKPPAFSFMSSYNGYLYALGPGVPQAAVYRPFPENLRFYFTGTQYSLTNWINPVTKTPFFQNCQTNQDNADNFEAIAQVNSGLVFFARNTLQIWQGINPPIPRLQNIISLTKVMPVGCVHGNLIVQLPNDAAFVSLYGIQTLSSINISQQYATTSSIGGPVDKTFNQANDYIFENNRNYRQCRSFKYPIGLFLGFKMLPKMIMFSLTDLSQGWFFFSGDFARASGYAEEGRLLLGIDNKLYRYADDIGVPRAGDFLGRLTPGRNWADGNGQNLIEWSWVTPWARAGLNRFKNNRYEIYLEPTTTYNQPTAEDEFLDISTGFESPDPAFNISVSYALNNNISNNSLQATPKLDTFGAFWDENYWDGASWAGTFYNPIGKMKFLSSTFTLLVSGQTNVGPIEIYEIRMYGKGEI